MKILCIGHSTYDITTIVDEFPKENTKNRISERVECCGGPAGNAAYLLSKWGEDVYFAGKVGNDIYGKKIRDEFRNIGVNVDYLQMANDYVTTTSFIIANRKNGSRTVFSYRPTNEPMREIDIEIKPDIILIDGHEYEISRKVIEENPEATVIIDASRDRKEVKELCCMSDYVVCSREFMEKVSNIELDRKENLDIAFTTLESEFQTNIIVTLESDGCAYRAPDSKVTIVPAVKVKTVDSTGAGDIFHGAFAYGIAKKWPIEKVLKFANLAGSMSVTQIGSRNSMFMIEEMEKVFDEIK